jgi:hypothetical protein
MPDGSGGGQTNATKKEKDSVERRAERMASGPLPQLPQKHHQTAYSESYQEEGTCLFHAYFVKLSPQQSGRVLRPT